MNPHVLIAIVLLPLAAAIIAGLAGQRIGRVASHSIAIGGVALSCVLSLHILWQSYTAGVPTFDAPVYTWLASDSVTMQVGFLIDRLSALMMAVVTFVSLCVHVYTVGYMRDDPGYQRFFSYISLFTFSMLMLVMANNFMQLFFGWEAVGLVSYLLIGFWYTRPSAIAANLKAFLVNRVGDFGFVLGIAGVLYYTGSLHYSDAFSAAPHIAQQMLPLSATGSAPALTLICICLFIGAMGKSAQVPLHVWLPDSMEGPTPISALIHAATMVTAGIFMVSRMSPLFELSEAALSFVLVIGGITAFFMALVAVVQYDIKRVIAYSTLSQLGYMTVALGASAYSVGMFHLMTHAFFKAVLFLGAGSVIIALHHEQDMRKMGGLRKYMPITYLTMLIGALANAGLPPFAWFFSKDSILEAVHLSHTPGAGFAYLMVLAGVFVGGLYSFRLIFYTFHGEERFAAHESGHGHAADDHGHDARHGAAVDDHGHDAGHDHVPHESPAVVTLPLILLAIPSVAAGWTIGSVLYGGYFGSAIFIAPEHEGLAEMAREFHGVTEMMLHGLASLPFWFALAGAATAWYLYIARPDLPAVLRRKAGVLVTILEEKYGFDRFNDWFFAGGARALGGALWKIGDVAIIDGFMVNGTARVVGWLGGMVRLFQSGYIYQYAFTMIIGVFVLLTWWFLRT